MTAATVHMPGGYQTRLDAVRDAGLRSVHVIGAARAPPEIPVNPSRSSKCCRPPVP
jgi:hypothetical protein